MHWKCINCISSYDVFENFGKILGKLNNLEKLVYKLFGIFWKLQKRFSKYV